jgi:hypothetical protein
MLVPVEVAGEPLTLSEPCESGLPCFDLHSSPEKTQGSNAQPLGEFVEPRRETRRPVNDHVGQLGEGILLR